MSDRLWRANPAFRRLTVARVVSVGGDSLSLVALMLHVAATSGQALAVAALLLVGDLVPSLLSPLSGAIGDRFDRKRVMITCELVQGAVLLVIALTLPAAAAAVGAWSPCGPWSARCSCPRRRAALPALVAPADLGSRPTPRSGSAPTAPRPLGPLAAAGAAAAARGVGGAAGGRGVVRGGGGLARAAARAAAHRCRVRGGPVHAHGAQARAGLGYLWSHRPLRIILLGYCGVVCANGIDDVALVVLGTDDLRADQSAVALLLGAVGIGLLSGTRCWPAGRPGCRWPCCSSWASRCPASATC